MARRANNNENHPPGAGKGGVIPPAEHRFKKGASGNPKGRRNAGAVEKDWMNAMGETATEAELLRIYRDPEQPQLKRAAAERLLHSLSPDMADFQPILDGTMDIQKLRETGVDTSCVKKVRQRSEYDKDGNVVAVTREVELHDRSGEEFDRIADRTDGKPTQAVQVGTDTPTVFKIITPLTRHLMQDAEPN